MLNILLIDNDDQCLQAYTIALEPGNFRCITAGNPETAIELYRDLFNTINRIDVVITDLLMPGMSGLDLLRRVKDFDEDARIIIITAFPDSLLLQTEYAAQAYAVFPKPLHFPSLISVLRKIEEDNKREMT